MIQGPLVLVVDDFQDNREMYAEFLAYSGFRVNPGRQREGGADQAFANRPDIIIMDLSLP